MSNTSTTYNPHQSALVNIVEQLMASYATDLRKDGHALNFTKGDLAQVVEMVDAAIYDTIDEYFNS